MEKTMASPVKLLLVGFGKNVKDDVPRRFDEIVPEPHQWIEPLAVEGEAFPEETFQARAANADAILIAGDLKGLPHAASLARAAAPMLLADPALVFHP